MGTREIVSPPYVIVYRSTGEIVEILYIWHGRKTGAEKLGQVGRTVHQTQAIC
jgi:hypothetical protein